MRFLKAIGVLLVARTVFAIVQAMAGVDESGFFDFVSLCLSILIAVLWYQSQANIQEADGPHQPRQGHEVSTRNVSGSAAGRGQAASRGSEDLFIRNWRAVQAVRSHALDDTFGTPLNERTGASERAAAIRRVLGSDRDDLYRLCHHSVSMIIEFLRERRFTIDVVRHAMAVPDPSSTFEEEGLAALAYQALVHRPELGGSNQSGLEIATPHALAGVAAWYATLLTRLETRGDIAPLPNP